MIIIPFILLDSLFEMSMTVLVFNSSDVVQKLNKYIHNNCTDVMQTYE